MELSSDEDVLDRAYKAYFRRDSNMPYPGNDSSVEDYRSRTYAVLRNCNGILATYRVLNSGKLKYLRRWPKALEEY